MDSPSEDSRRAGCVVAYAVAWRCIRGENATTGEERRGTGTMANEKHLAILKQGVDTWNAWRQQNPQIRADLSFAKLAGINLGRVDLEFGNLFRADLAHANLRKSNLAWAFLASAHFEGANLKQANITGANLRKAILHDASLASAYLAGANLEGANLDGASLVLTSLVGANFTRASLSGANFHGATVDEKTRFDFHVGVPFLESILAIPLDERVPAGQMGFLLHGLDDLYAIVGDMSYQRLETPELLASRISIGTPNVAELIGELPQMMAIVAALVALLKVPKVAGEAAEKIANARKTWIEGTLLKRKLADEPQAPKRLSEPCLARIEVTFDAIAQGRYIVSGEPKLRIVGAEAAEDKEGSEED